ncbi:MAG: hypothetical protein AAGF29_07730, partial [Pseudomonadota bacterium]
VSPRDLSHWLLFVRFVIAYAQYVGVFTVRCHVKNVLHRTNRAPGVHWSKCDAIINQIKDLRLRVYSCRAQK